MINSTIVQSEGIGVYCVDASPLVANNILAFNTTDGFRRDAGQPVLRNNCVFGNIESNYYAWTAGTNDLIVDPGFVNRAQGDVHLAVGSPCRNKGDTSAIQPSWMDLDGLLRVFGNTVDIGA